MSLVARLESKLGRYAVPGLMTYLIAGQVTVYILELLQMGPPGQGVLELVWLLPDRVLAGEVWRIFTFLLQPPGGRGGVLGPIFLFFYWYLLYYFSSILEQHWGTFRFNLYLLVGWLATVAVSFFVPPGAITNAYLYTSVFLAFAHLYPDFELRIYFLIPVKVKWLALLTWLGFAYNIYLWGWPQLLIVAATVADFFLFLGGSIWQRARHRWRGKRFRQQVQKGEAVHAAMVHRCRVCGLTSEESPRTQFRYCSKCDDESCYCPEHLRNHEHVTRETPEEVSGQRREA